MGYTLPLAVGLPLRGQVTSEMVKFHDPEYKRFLENLKAARKEAGLTQVEVARRLGCHQSFVAKSESGERRVDVVELARFAKLYRKPLEFFIDE